MRLAVTAKLLGRRGLDELETLVTTLSVSEAQQRAEAVVAELGWELVASDESAGIVEATETTAMWGFKDDVVVRVRDSQRPTRIL